LQKAQTHTSSHKERTCAQTLKSYKDLQSVHESWNNSSKHKNIRHQKIFCAVFTDSLLAHTFEHEVRAHISFWHRRSVNR
jgi:hypothetical protein